MRGKPNNSSQRVARTVRNDGMGTWSSMPSRPQVQALKRPMSLARALGEPANIRRGATTITVYNKRKAA
jgi:hypothetical protein